MTHEIKKAHRYVCKGCYTYNFRTKPTQNVS